MRVKMRIKNWGYAWQMSNDTKWVDRAWNELEVCSASIEVAKSSV
jgi:hypothetical protein